MLSNATSLTERIYNFSRDSGPDITPAWVEPSVSDTSFQSLMGSAYLYKHSSITMSSQFTAQSQISTSAANTVVPLYPSLPANFVKVAPPQIPNQGHSLSFPYQERSEVYYYNQNILGPLISLELVSSLQSHGTVSYEGGRASVPQTEMVMVLKDGTNILTSICISGVFHSGTAQSITERSLQGEYKGQKEKRMISIQKDSQLFR
jgi:hypothetical protein